MPNESDTDKLYNELTGEPYDPLKALLDNHEKWKWVPEELQSELGQFTPEGLQAIQNASESARPAFIKALQGMKDKKDWLDLRQLKEHANKEVPQSQIESVLDPARKYSTDWQTALLRHPKVKLTPDQLNNIYGSGGLNSSVKAEAWLRHGKEGEVPSFLHPAHLGAGSYGPRAKEIFKLPDEKLASIMNNASKMDYNPSEEHHNYDTEQFARNFRDLRESRHGEPGLNMPLLEQAIVNHPNARIAAKLLPVARLSDDQVNSFIEKTKPTLNGKPLTDEEWSMNNANPDMENVLNDPLVGGDGQVMSEEQRQKLRDHQDAVWKENKNKTELLESLVQNEHLTPGQIDKLTDHVNEVVNKSPGLYDVNLARKLSRTPHITPEQQTKLLDNSHIMSLELAHDKAIIDRGQKGNIKPETLNALFPKMFAQAHKDSNGESYNEHSDLAKDLVTHPATSTENLKLAQDTIKKDLAERGTSIMTAHEIGSHPNASPELLHEAWNIANHPTPKEVEKLALKDPDRMQSRISSIGRMLLENPKTPSELTTDVLHRSNITKADYPSMTDEHRKMMLDKAKAGDYGSPEKTQAAIENIVTHAKNPDLIREAFAHSKQKWDAEGLPDQYKGKVIGNRRLMSDIEDNLIHFTKNPNTPKDVIEGIHNDFPDAQLMEHPNFPSERIEHYANLPDKEGDTINEKWNRTKAREMLAHINPDKYSYTEGGPGENLPAQKKDRDFGSTQVKPGLSKLRVFRDKILEIDPAKGELSPKTLGQGPFAGGWKPVQEKNGNISAKKIQELIDAHPSTKYNFAHQEWTGAQRHSDHPQRVFKLNATTDHISQMKAAGVYGTFKKLSQYSAESGHPGDAGHTLGWVRYEHHMNTPKIPGGGTTKDPETGEEVGHDEAVKLHDTRHSEPEAIHVDEIQTDMGPNTIAKLKENPERAKSMGVDTTHLDTINKIVFGDHHPSETILEAFRQHHRDQGRSGVPIHMLHAATKAPISGMSNKDLPAHMKFTYDQMPKKMGFTPNKYGNDTVQQDEPNHQGKPTWSDKIRKHEDELLVKALDDIKPGKPTNTFPSRAQAKLPDQVGHGRTHYFDYNHLLTPEHKRAGYQLYVRFHPESKIDANLFHKGKNIGSAEANYNLYDPSKLRIDNVAIGDDKNNPKHRGKGLGSAMYEAVLAHAKHVGGVTEVKGGTHSSMAHAVHQKIARKHGLGYDALPGYMEGKRNADGIFEPQDQHWPDQESWEAHPDGPYDDKWGPYKFMLKSETKERPFRAAGFRDPETNEIFETGLFHDIGALPEHHQDNFERLDQGFITHQGTFLNREQAAKYVNMKPKHEGLPTDAPRQWLDSRDNEAFSSTEPGVSIKKHEDGIMAMLESGNPIEQILALKSKGVLPHHILIAIKDPNPQIRMFAASHPSINSPTLLHCLRQCQDPETFNLLLGHDSAGDEHINYALETDWGGNGGPEEVKDEEII